MRSRRSGAGLPGNFSFSSADLKQLRTDNLSRKQRERIKAVSETNHRHSWTPDMRKSYSATGLMNKTWSSGQTMNDVIHEEEQHNTSENSLSPPTALNRLFSRDASEPNSAETDQSGSSPDFFRRRKGKPAMFTLSSGESFDESPLDTPMKDMVCRNNNNNKSSRSKKHTHEQKGQWCYVCLCKSPETPLERQKTDSISESALAHINVSTEYFLPFMVMDIASA